MKRLLGALAVLCGFMICGTVQPRSCSHLKKLFGVTEDANYELFPPVLYNQSVIIYCHNMSEAPQDFVTLQYFNGGNFPNTTNTDCTGNEKPVQDQSHFGSSNFSKIRINMTTMQIFLDDFTFASTTGKPLSYGEAGDCYAPHPNNKTDCHPVGHFVIDFRNTGLRLSSNMIWDVKGHHYLFEVRSFYDGLQKQITCGGYCGYCFLPPNVTLIRNKVDGGWSVWVLRSKQSCNGECGKSGFRNVMYRRNCSAPHRQRGGRHCVGADWKIMVEDCFKPCTTATQKKVSTVNMTTGQISGTGQEADSDKNKTNTKDKDDKIRMMGKKYQIKNLNQAGNIKEMNNNSSSSSNSNRNENGEHVTGGLGVSVQKGQVTESWKKTEFVAGEQADDRSSDGLNIPPVQESVPSSQSFSSIYQIGTNETSRKHSPPKSSKQKRGHMTGIVVGVFVWMLLIVIFISISWIRKRKQRVKESMNVAHNRYERMKTPHDPSSINMYEINWNLGWKKEEEENTLTSSDDKEEAEAAASPDDKTRNQMKYTRF